VEPEGQEFSAGQWVVWKIPELVGSHSTTIQLSQRSASCSAVPLLSPAGASRCPSPFSFH
jgi:hypothetical protein